MALHELGNRVLFRCDGLEALGTIIVVKEGCYLDGSSGYIVTDFQHIEGPGGWIIDDDHIKYDEIPEQYHGQLGWNIRDKHIKPHVTEKGNSLI